MTGPQNSLAPPLSKHSHPLNGVVLSAFHPCVKHLRSRIKGLPQVSKCHHLQRATQQILIFKHMFLGNIPDPAHNWLFPSSSRTSFPACPLQHDSRGRGSAVGEITQLVKGLFYKHWDLSLILRAHVKESHALIIQALGVWGWIASQPRLLLNSRILRGFVSKGGENGT